jgi:hypothetical protein
MQLVTSPIAANLLGRSTYLLLQAKKIAAEDSSTDEQEPSHRAKPDDLTR